MSGFCDETAAIEALHDGRLDIEQSAALRLHLVTCASCTREVERLEAIRGLLRALPVPQTSSFHVAGGRRRLLAAARGSARSAWIRRVTGASLLIAAAAGAVLGVRALTPSRSAERGAAPVQVAAAPELELRVEPGEGAVWSRTTTASEERVTLREGTLDIAVTRHGSARRVLVQTPDGELEDVGTVFRVEVARARTHAVRVREGKVAVRLRGMDARELAAGETFVLEESPIASAAPEPATPPVVERDRRQSTDKAAIPERRAGRPPTDAEACPGAPRFEDCVATFKRGEYEAAAAAFARYTEACGRHAEDATYLRMVALARAGRMADARTLARTYVQHFPEGFRRKEAEKLLQ